MYIPFKNTKLAHSRHISAELGKHGDCNKCGTSSVTVLDIDTSDGEYGSASICMDCLEDIIRIAKNEFN